jgi:CDP-glucose 4,6-dehydratase
MIHSVIGDIRDLSKVSEVFKDSRPEIVIHAAAQAIVRRSYRDPVETYATNIMGTVHVLEASRHTPSLKSLVVVTSDKCYENRERSEGYREEDAMGGHDPYSSSKGAAELVTAAYRRSFFSHDGSARVASARAGNIIGGGDWADDRLLPDLIRGICSGSPVIIRHPASIRPWQHVLDPICGYLMLAERLFEEGGTYAEAWNFGPRGEAAVTVGEIATRVLSTWGSGELNIQPDAAHLHEARTLQLNCDKSSRLLGWKPHLSLEQAINWTVEWYRSFYQGSQLPRVVTEKQICQYMKALYK